MCSKVGNDHATLDASDLRYELQNCYHRLCCHLDGPWAHGGGTFIMLSLRLGSPTRGLRCKLHVLYDPFYKRHGAKVGKGIEASDIVIAACCVLRLRSS
jgi:hypothetical protein